MMLLIVLPQTTAPSWEQGCRWDISTPFLWSHKLRSCFIFRIMLCFILTVSIVFCKSIYRGSSWPKAKLLITHKYMVWDVGLDLS